MVAGWRCGRAEPGDDGCLFLFLFLSLSLSPGTSAAGPVPPDLRSALLPPAHPQVPPLHQPHLRRGQGLLLRPEGVTVPASTTHLMTACSTTQRIIWCTLRLGRTHTHHIQQNTTHTHFQDGKNSTLIWYTRVTKECRRQEVVIYWLFIRLTHSAPEHSCRKPCRPLLMDIWTALMSFPACVSLSPHHIGQLLILRSISNPCLLIGGEKGN